MHVHFLKPHACRCTYTCTHTQTQAQTQTQTQTQTLTLALTLTPALALTLTLTRTNTNTKTKTQTHTNTCAGLQSELRNLMFFYTRAHHRKNAHHSIAGTQIGVPICFTEYPQTSSLAAELWIPCCRLLTTEHKLPPRILGDRSYTHTGRGSNQIGFHPWYGCVAGISSELASGA